ncbi:DUF2785 domain-containing protein [Lactobacillus selangorensis]|uniref:DUF2785 domain-containing protein n=1 Tax=Lactobacillus selangorensis TaxID=81857 RepID=UPI0007090DAE|nr:DUF2785 domain-containing protein [Lactobacillus selangorensis]
MVDQVAQTRQQLKKIQQQFMAGESFHELPERLNQLAKQVTYAADKTPVVLPRDTQTALARVKQIDDELKQSDEPQISNDDLQFLLAHLGVTNARLRDRGVYFLFNDLIRLTAFTPEQEEWLVMQLISPAYMFDHILEPHNNAVFKRSFAVMLLAGLLYADRHYYHVLSSAEINAVILAMATYMLLEQDGRGYIDHKGWAHSYTHIGNVLDELFQSTVLNRANKLFLLAAFYTGYRQMNDPLIYGEPQRLAMAVANLTNLNTLYTDYLLLILQDWQKEIAQLQPEQNIAFWNRWYNRDRLLQSMLVRGDQPQKIQDYLGKIIDMY